MMLATACAPSNAPGSDQATSSAVPTVTIRTRDFGFEAPDTVPAGLVSWRMVNDGPGVHHVQIVRLDSAKTVDDVLAALKTPVPFPMWIVPVGGPNAVEAGGESAVTMELAPGRYALICVVDLPDHVPHVAKGMARALTVTAAHAPAPALAAADLTITLRDFAFEMPESLSAGRHAIDVQIEAQQPHELVIFKLKAGATVQSFMAWGATYEGPPPAAVLGGLAAAVPGTRARIEVDLSPGTYVRMCFVPDQADGTPHVLKGMMRVVQVT